MLSLSFSPDSGGLKYLGPRWKSPTPFPSPSFLLFNQTMKNTYFFLHFHRPRPFGAQSETLNMVFFFFLLLLLKKRAFVYYLISYNIVYNDVLFIKWREEIKLHS